MEDLLLEQGALSRLGDSLKKKYNTGIFLKDKNDSWILKEEKRGWKTYAGD